MISIPAALRLLRGHIRGGHPRYKNKDKVRVKSETGQRLKPIFAGKVLSTPRKWNKIQFSLRFSNYQKLVKNRPFDLVLSERTSTFDFSSLNWKKEHSRCPWNFSSFKEIKFACSFSKRRLVKLTKSRVSEHPAPRCLNDRKNSIFLHSKT